MLFETVLSAKAKIEFLSLSGFLLPPVALQGCVRLFSVGESAVCHLGYFKIWSRITPYRRREPKARKCSRFP